MASAFEKLDMGILFPKGNEKRLTWLGKHQWLKITPGVAPHVEMKVVMPPYSPGIDPREYHGLAYSLKNVRQEDRFNPLWMYGLSRFMAGGPKLFRPTMEQCEAMSQVDIDIPIKEYRQPYESILYQYPEAFGKRMADELGVTRFPIMALCVHDGQAIMVSSLFKEGDAISAMIPPRQDMTIEEILSFEHVEQKRITPIDKAEFRMGEMLQRIALNFSLMMTHYKVKDEPLNPEAYKKHREMAKDKKNRAKREMGERLSLTDMRLIEFEQNITMYDRQPSAGPHEETGLHVKPHWRRGHWRMQVHGPQNTLRKRVFIKPLMVNAGQFVGDVSDTTVVYRGTP